MISSTVYEEFKKSVIDEEKLKKEPTEKELARKELAYDKAYLCVDRILKKMEVSRMSKE